jgi:hypothetical protein
MIGRIDELVMMMMMITMIIIDDDDADDNDDWYSMISTSRYTSQILREG